jgi:uncharacterized protein (DUF2141 family)
MRPLLISTCILLFFSCANVTAPTGGPKDETPPKLISSIPKQGQTNYPGRGITLEFDEYLKIKNPKEEIIITPAVSDPKFILKKNTFQIEFAEKLKDSTTYSIAFREAIQDLNEGNPAEDLRLAFSTGNQIDSLKITGRVTQLLRGTPAEKYTVAVYWQDTFNIFKHKPVYFTRTNKEGKFNITNLKSGNYFIYAWEDKNKNLSLESQTEKFGLLTEPILLKNNLDSVMISTLALDSRPVTVTGIRSLGHFTKVRLNKNITGYSIHSLDATDKKIKHCFSSSQSEIDIFPNKAIGDSTKIHLSAVDSLEQKLDTIFFIKQTDAKSLKEKITVTIGETKLQEETQRLTTKIQLSELISRINSDSIYILLDSSKRITFTEKDIQYDTIFKRIYINKEFRKSDSIIWAKRKFYLGTGSFISIFNDTSKKASSPISVAKSDETATLIIENKAVKQNTLLEIVNDRYETIAIQKHAKVTVFKTLPASTVRLRSIEDTNNNGKWDPGNPNEKVLPEKITYYINNQKKTEIPLRSNWEVNIMWNF